jgi:isochorismate synthase
MEYLKLLDSISKQHKRNLPFVLFSLPESEEISYMAQKDDKLYSTVDYQDQCFVFSQFDYHEEAYCIPADRSEVFETILNRDAIDINEIEIDEDPSIKDNYCDLVEKTIRVILSGKATKIVISRSKTISLNTFDISALAHRLMNLYPSAFKYIWYHPKTGLWCGASPEVLVKTEGQSFSTMALAGTQKYKENKNPKWSDKEREEHQIVIDAISDRLQKVTSVLRISKTYNRRAASVVHLCADITGILKKGKANLPNITSNLHPTPAVCGSPQNIAKKYILSNEGYDREYYTGFLGPVCEKKACSNLFVNLRCMKIEDDIVTLFVGGGITLASNPLDEWTETQNKMVTMLHVIQPML